MVSGITRNKKQLLRLADRQPGLGITGWSLDSYVCSLQMVSHKVDDGHNRSGRDSGVLRNMGHDGAYGDRIISNELVMRRAC